jgi:hypothetical protein
LRYRDCYHAHTKCTWRKIHCSLVIFTFTLGLCKSVASIMVEKANK